MKKVCFFLLSILFFACNNWKENPVEIENTYTAAKDQSLITILNFPVNTSKIFQVDQNLVLAGSGDGKIYKSSDNGLTWAKKHETDNKSSVTCFYSYESADKKSKIFFAGTLNGIYSSGDYGENWNKCLADDKGNNLKINCFDITKGTGQTNDTINSYGWDGTYNRFFSIDLGKTWNKTLKKLANSGEINCSILAELYTMWNVIEKYSYYGLSYNSKAVVVRENNAFFQIGTGTTVTALLAFNRNLYVGTDDGLILGVFMAWRRSGLNGQYIKNLISINGIIYASTNNGVFYSKDGGSEWNELYFSYKTETINDLFVNDNKLTIIKNSGELVAFNIPNISSSTVFNPVVISPLDSSTVSSGEATVRFENFSDRINSITAIQISTDPNFPSDGSKVYDYITDGSFNLKSLNKDTRYYWRFLSYTLFKRTVWSKTYTFITKG